MLYTFIYSNDRRQIGSTCQIYTKENVCSNHERTWECNDDALIAAEKLLHIIKFTYLILVLLFDEFVGV